MKKKFKGFTLVELIVVIAIIGVLAAILVPSLSGYVKKSRLQSANSSAKTAYNAVATYITDCEVAGKPLSDVKTEATCVATTVPTTATSIATALQIALADNGNAAGLAYVIADSSDATKVAAVQWKKTLKDTVIGQYPDAPTDVSQTVVWGTKFTPPTDSD